jgi:NADH-ubiquinone oxidoreductase chain 5
MVIGSLALIGFPFLTGFYSKDIILEIAYGKFSTFGHYSYYLGSLGAFFTAFYSTRLLYLTFLTKPNGFKSVLLNAEDSSYQIVFSLILLSLPSIFFGYFAKDLFIGFGSDLWGNSIYILTQNLDLIDSEFIGISYKLLPLYLSFTGVFMAFILYFLNQKVLFALKITKIGKFAYNFINKKWFFDKIYNEYIRFIKY